MKWNKSGLSLGLCALLYAASIGAPQAKGDQPPSPATVEAGKAPPDDAKMVPDASPVPVFPEWKDKQVSDWTEADAKQLLTDSPWAKSVTPTSDKPLEKAQPKAAHHGGFGIAGLGLGRHNSSKETSPADTASNANSSSSSNAAPAIPKLRLRWESALPIREAELKARDTGALAVDENHYAIAVYGIPGRMVKDDSKKFADQLKAQAALKRDAKTDIKPSSVEIRMRDDGPVILFLFPRTEEITWRDHQLEFGAQIGPLKIKQAFQPDDMRFHGALEL